VSKVVHLFPDTNLFLQCRPLDQLDWSDWRDADEVHVVVTRPVQAEIDEHKNKGNERRARRARAASGMLREILIKDARSRVVRENGPIVKLVIDVNTRPSPEHAEMLDYENPDDRLVGTIKAYVDANPGTQAFLLTDDFGPMASADMLGVPFVPIPEAWLLPPEPSEADREIRALKAEIARLKETEPHITVVCVNAQGGELDQLEFEQKRYEALTDGDLSRLAGELSNRFPLAKDFGSRERSERLAKRGILQAREVFTPASDRDIQTYREEHAAWLKACESRLRNLHHALGWRDGRPALAFKVANEGSRPATEVLLTLRAKGGFLIAPPAREEDEEDEQEDPFTLPPPPKAPAGRWEPAPLAALGGLDMLELLHQMNSSFRARPGRDVDLNHLVPRVHKPDDPNRFYYKPERPRGPIHEFSLTCHQWRHGVEAKLFTVEICSTIRDGSVAGALECVIHAGNMSSLVTKLIPVRGRMMLQPALSTAENMVARLLAGSGV